MVQTIGLKNVDKEDVRNLLNAEKDRVLVKYLETHCYQMELK